MLESTIYFKNENQFIFTENARMKSLSYIEEKTTQWPKEKEQKDKQQSTKLTYKTKNLVTWTPLEPEG